MYTNYITNGHLHKRYMKPCSFCFTFIPKYSNVLNIKKNYFMCIYFNNKSIHSSNFPVSRDSNKQTVSSADEQDPPIKK